MITDLAGARLKQVRLDKGLSIEEVHKKTKIHLDILKAIEEGGLINFSPVYIKGFLKIYCQFLGVDPKDYVTGFKGTSVTFRAVPPPDNQKETPFLGLSPIRLKSLKPKIKIVYIFIALLITFLFLFKLGKGISARFRSPDIVKPASFVLAKPGDSRMRPASRVPELLPIKAKLKAKDNIAGSLKSFSSLIRLSIHAKEDCWIRVKIDGKIVPSLSLKRGKTETWQAKEKIEFSLGNATAVDIEVNNKLIPSIGRKGQPIKKALVTKEGLISVSR